MILFSLLVIFLIGLVTVALVFGSAFLAVFGDIIVFMLIIALIVKLIKRIRKG